MVRLVKFQSPDEGTFAFFDTITDTFLEFNGVQSFDDFEEEVAWSYENNCDDSSRRFDIERLKGLLPAARENKELGGTASNNQSDK